MEIDNLTKVKYISRPNRFTVEFKNKNNEIELAHLHDPGRLRELLIPETNLLIKYVSTYKETNRKTKYDVIAIEYEDKWVLLNSSFHNSLVEELINNKEILELKEYFVFKREYTYGNSRLDFLLKNSSDKLNYLEVKGCTLVENTIAKFPDAPTLRGKKHVDELIKIQKENQKSTIIILILQNSAKKFSPNYNTDPEFSKSLEEACKNNVQILPVHIITNLEDTKLLLTYDKILPIILKTN